MSRYPGSNVLVIMLAGVLFLSLSVSSTMEEDTLFGGWTREEMVEMAGYGEEDLSKVLVTGSVSCEAYLHDGRQLRAWPVSGALVAVECRKEGMGGRPIQTRGITDEDGGFAIKLPSELHSVADLQRKCCVQLLRTPRGSSCRPVGIRKHGRISLLPDTRGIRTYEAEKIRLLHSASARPQAHVKQEKGGMDGSW
ncbi:hypothetical protein MLD38_019444 [Melastoma candidum]|uniref:Uncharacterized protein n=1 Tax=Melastoma candidum TaxID=119954 RepID=A0ACB9R131_9MYRT|nr:hypothetical protein MLD38_019444 [Melastoma candidum]